MNRLLRLRPLTLAVTGLIFFTLGGREADARVNLDVLRNDGYGVVELKRPDPNVLTVIADINGHKVRLILDTGWAPDGIFLHSDQESALRFHTQAIKGDLTSAHGKSVHGFRGGRAEKISIGNVELSDVPVFFGNIKPLRQGIVFHKLGADGFLGAGFMKTCSAVIDMQNLLLYFRPPGKGHRAVLGPALKGAGFAVAPMDAQNAVAVSINGAPGKMAVDTGSYHAGVDLRFAEKIKAATRRSNVGSLDASGDLGRTQLMQLRSFAIGGVPAKAYDMRLTHFGFYSPEGLIGLLGMDILGPNGAIIDYGSRALFFYPEGN